MTVASDWGDLPTNPGICALAHEPLRVHLGELVRDVADHEARLRAIERIHWRTTGIVAAAATAGGLLGQLGALFK